MEKVNKENIIDYLVKARKLFDEHEVPKKYEYIKMSKESCEEFKRECIKHGVNLKTDN